METIETNRKRLLNQQTELRGLLTTKKRFEEGMQLFFEQHASLHTQQIARHSPAGRVADIWSYEDALLDDLSEGGFRHIPNNAEHSIAWCIWHLARIEDTAMNILVADSSQVLITGSWQARLGVPYQDSGNELAGKEMQKLSQEIDLQALRDYRAAVGHQTQQITSQLDASDLTRKVDPTRIQRVLDEGAITPGARGITDYWSKRTIAGLLLMPASRHILVHLNEALKLKQKKN
jgi:hypothetical protein